MSKLNIGVGEDFPLDDADKQREFQTRCEAYWHARRMRHRHWRHRRHHPGPGAALIVLPAAAASVTAAILYPLAALGVIGGLGLAAAAYRHGRWQRDDRPHEPPHGDKPEPPKESA